LTVELYNKGDTDVENIQLNVNIENNNLLFIPKKTYNIPNLSAGKSTEIHIFVFGFGSGIFYDYPLITLTVDSSSIQTFWKMVTISIIGVKTKIFNEITFNQESFEGYTIFAPEFSTYTYLIDKNGKIVHTWESDYIQGFGTYLLENRNLLRLDLPGVNPTFRAGGIAGRVEKFDERSNLIWEFEYFDDQYCAHHDIEPLPNGNVLLIAWEYKTREESINAGRNPDRLKGNSLWPDHIVEVEPTGSIGGKIVWEWHVWDHLIQDYDPIKDNYGVVEDHPELIDINYGDVGNHYADWNHCNSIDYNEELDQIVVSVRVFNEIWVIDHSTTTEEASGHIGGNSGKGGDILYRWGNPQAYKAGIASDQKFFAQHGTIWIEEGCPGEGNLLVFNNGNINRPYSSVDEIVPPIDSSGNYIINLGEAYGPDEPIWSYNAENPTELYSGLLSNAQRLPNGNTLLCSAKQGLFLEITPDKNVAWEYKNYLPTERRNDVARVERYPLDYPGIPKIKSKSVDEIWMSLNDLFN